MSKYINENKRTPYEATLEGLDAGAGSILITFNNGVIEVKHGGDGSLLMQSKNVSEGTMDKIWTLLEDCGDVDFRA